MTAKLYTDEQIRDFHGQYINIGNKSISTFARERKLSFASLQRGFQRLGLSVIPQSIVRHKFPINEDYFESIDTEEKAYVLGFMYADGCNDAKYRRVSISLAKQDEDILIRLSKILLDGNVGIKEYAYKNSNQQNRVMLNIISQKMSDDLTKQGCVPRKTFVLKFPDLPKHLWQHFTRGYFDGDGMLVIYKRRMSRCIRETKTAEFSIVSTKEMLDKIGNIITDLGAHYKISKRHKNRDNNNFTLRVFGNRQIKTVCDWMYKDATIFMSRKHETYMRLVEMSKTFRKRYQYV